jgi:hypothetical protein
MMRRPILGSALTLVICLLAPSGRAQAQLLGGTGGDPFNLYYGYYLPHAAAIAAQPTPLDTINQITAQRQYSAMTDRAGLYDPISPYGSEEEQDPLRPYSPSRKGERIGKPVAFANATSNARGMGPALYYSRTARYYPQMRAGHGPNRNLGASRSRGSSMGGGGGGMAGPR